MVGVGVGPGVLEAVVEGAGTRVEGAEPRVEGAGPRVEGVVPGVEGAGPGVEGAGPRRRRKLAHNQSLFMMRTLGLPSLPFNQVVRQGFILIGMSSVEL